MNTPVSRIAVFDLDGTLLDTLDDLTDAVNHALTAAAFPSRTRDEIRAFVGDGVEMLMRRALPSAFMKRACDGSTAPDCERVVQACLSDFKTAYAAACEVKTAPYPGILELLDRLRVAGVRIAVVSNKYDAAVKRLCAHYFGDRIEVAIGEQEDRGIRKKPAPDTVFEALKTLGVRTDLRATPTIDRPAASSIRAVYIGDSDTDIQTAQNATLPCISVTWGFRDKSFLLASGAEMLAHTPDELFSLLTES